MIFWRGGKIHKEMSTRNNLSLSLTLKEDSLNVIMDRNSLRHANSISRLWTTAFPPLAPPTVVLVQFSHHLAPQLWRNCATYRWNGNKRRKKGEGRRKKRRRVRYEREGKRRDRMKSFQSWTTNYSLLITKVERGDTLPLEHLVNNSRLDSRRFSILWEKLRARDRSPPAKFNPLF